MVRRLGKELHFFFFFWNLQSVRKASDKSGWAISYFSHEYDNHPVGYGKRSVFYQAFGTFSYCKYISHWHHLIPLPSPTSQPEPLRWSQTKDEEVDSSKSNRDNLTHPLRANKVFNSWWLKLNLFSNNTLTAQQNYFISKTNKSSHHMAHSITIYL
jgi:hypothetical protein